ncbi:unnamed protein product [Paramecium pentaurelia]|uniref:UDENN domain-containing protein n=1 Tax=Paramecium pentaurelia TaxID=43138 RepID=A0A8S1VUK3_9CILI|nr:unnamed protein product [Paramecium pentaurelia]
MLIDYFLVIGLQTKSNEISLTNILNKKQEPEMIIMHPMDQPAPDYIENIKMWCFPNGVQYFNQDLKRIDLDNKSEQIITEDIRSQDQLSHFVLTDEKGQQKFCTSLLYYEKVYVKNKHKHFQKLSKTFPKIAIKQIIKNPLILDEDTQLIYAPKTITLVSHSPSFDLQRQFLVFFYNSYIIDRGLNSIGLCEDHLKQFERLVLTHGLNGAEQEWNQQEVIHLKQLEQDYIMDQDILEFYISVLFTLNKKTLLTDEDQNHEIRITKCEVHNEILRFRTNDQEILSLTNFTFRPLFSRLSLVNIMRIVMCIISEKQMLFFSSNISEIPQITEGLLSLIKPLKWSNIYIPCSNIDIWEYTQALQPYIIGFEKKHKQFLLTQIQEKVIVDLDEDSIIDNSHTIDDLKIPEKWLIELKNKLNQITTQLKYSPKQKIYQWMEAILKTKKAFFNFILQIVQNVLPFIKSLNDREPQQFTQTLKQCFDLQGYIKNHPEQEFITVIAKNTMTFSTFIEQVDDYYSLSKQVDPMIVSYVEYMKVQGQKNELDFHKLINSCLDKEIEKNLKNFSNPATIDLYPWMIKYRKFQDLFKEKNSEQVEQKENQQIVLHFYDEESRMKTRQLLNSKENIFSKFNQKKVINLKQIFTHQNVSNLVQNYKLISNSLKQLVKKPSENFDLDPILQKRKTLLRRHSTLMNEQLEGTKEDIMRLVESLQKQA